MPPVPRRVGGSNWMLGAGGLAPGRQVNAGVKVKQIVFGHAMTAINGRTTI